MSETTKKTTSKKTTTKKETNKVITATINDNVAKAKKKENDISDELKHDIQTQIADEISDYIASCVNDLAGKEKLYDDKIIELEAEKVEKLRKLEEEYNDKIATMISRRDKVRLGRQYAAAGLAGFKAGVLNGVIEEEG